MHRAARVFLAPVNLREIAHTNAPYKAIAEAFILLLSSFRPTTFLMIPEIVLVAFIALPADFLTWGIKVRDT